MARALDPEIAAGIRTAMAATAKAPAPVDLAGIRAALDAATESSPVPDAPGVAREGLQLTDELAARLDRPQDEVPGALVRADAHRAVDLVRDVRGQASATECVTRAPVDCSAPYSRSTSSSSD